MAQTSPRVLGGTKVSPLPSEAGGKGDTLKGRYVICGCIRSALSHMLTWATMKRKRKKNIYKRYGLSGREPLPPLDPATIEAYENGEAEPPLPVLLAYAEMVGIPVENLLDDDRDVWFGEWSPHTMSENF